ncbi:MAG: nucleoside recognition domain-containing protein [Alkalispirochaeta sp.]
MISAELRAHLTESLRRSRDTVFWLVRIMVPASAVVFILQRTGILAVIAEYLEPLMQVVGLPGGAAMALISSVLVNLYAVIAMLPVLGLDHRQLVILSLLCLVAHNFLVELAVTRRTGTPMRRMFLVRTGGGLLLAWVVSVIAPQTGMWIEAVPFPGTPEATGGTGSGLVQAELGTAILVWLRGLGLLLARVALIVSALVVFTRWLQFAGVTDRLAEAMRYPLRVLGLPASSAPAWIVANTLGLAYGAAVLKEEAETGRLNAADGDLLNHHLGVSHSLVEDTALFAAFGAPVAWLIIPRVALAVVVVWERRLERLLGLPTFRKHPAASDSAR